MTGGEHLKSLLLLLILELSGVRSNKNATVFVYSKVGEEALLQCSIASSDCSSITWTFFRSSEMHYSKEVINGQVTRNSKKASRMTITSNCSLILRDLVLGDVGSYVCLEHQKEITTVYLSILAISSPSSITELKPGRTVILSCIVSSFYDAGHCRQYSGGFNLRWLAEDGTEPTNHSRHQLTKRTHCNATLVLNLQKEDDSTRWRCQVETKAGKRETYVDFTSSFLFESISSTHDLQPPADGECPIRLPISRIVLCVALPLMVGMVGLVTWVSDRKRNSMLTAAEQHEIMRIRH